MSAVFFRSVEDGVLIDIRLTPRAAVDRIDGLKTRADGRAQLAARVRAVPEDGAANSALVEMMAKRLGIARSAITLVAGGTSREKRLHVAGDPAMLSEALAVLAG